jgi:uncharacterized protein (DUF433 family)
MEKASNAGKYEDRILRDPAICGGEPVFKGTRVTLRTVLAVLRPVMPQKTFLLIFQVFKQKTSKLPSLLPPHTN